jgi:chorismate dehydratase
MRRLRVSAISFLNTAPLMWDFDQGQIPGPNGQVRIAGNLEVSYTEPSQCARELASGAADIGIIPSIVYATQPGLAILPGVAIAARGPVRSILLVSKVPLPEVRTVAADSSSRTSVMLAQVLFRKFLGRAPDFHEMDPDLQSMLGAHDAALLIGDSALRIPLQASPLHIFDLAELWKRYTGETFVFAFWAIRIASLQEAETGPDLARLFRDSRDHGLQPENLQRIGRLWAPHVEISEAEVRQYLTHSIYYFLDDDARRGLELFYRYSVDCGLISAAPDLRFLGPASCLDERTPRDKSA